MANADGIIQGWIDYPLTALGHQQAIDTAEALRPLACRDVFTSPIGRARTTAGIVAAATAGASVSLLPGMTEVHAGAVTGRTWAEFGEIYPESYADYQQRCRILTSGEAKAVLPGWEPIDHVVYRTWQAIGAVLAIATGPRAIIVSHGDSISCLLTQAIHGTALAGDWRYRQANCGVSRLVLASTGPQLPDGVRILHRQAVT
ncbi:MAG: histidine phosphatase family protein [Candidatus Sericytochromatia bacterium]|nr:histidine phosphatase family protein [Candidatus Sericytochromatia bacterium]